MVVRDLTEEESAKHDAYAPVLAEARERLKLFQILSHNYREWKNYVDSLLSARVGHRDDEMQHLDRLLLNYLTCAYTIRQHFEVSFQQRFRKDKAKQKQYYDFLDKLCAASWEFAFFLDFRGYVQHRGLGIGFYNREISTTSVTITITCDAADLVAASREWKLSKLKGTEGSLELVPLLRDFHVQMVQSYGAFVANTFFPELSPAAEFYGHLTKEIQKENPSFKMVFLERDPEVREEGGKTHMTLNMIQVPNDVFGELGISAPKSA
jgi:hypothetical protein